MCVSAVNTIRPACMRLRVSDSNAPSEHHRWNDKYSDPSFTMPSYPIPALERWIEDLPDGRALDVATGSGRNAIFLAEHGYTVDAVDISDRALRRGQAQAEERGVSIEWLCADVREYPIPPATYDVLTMSFFDVRQTMPTIKEALAPGGVFIGEVHLRTSDMIDRGPNDPRRRARANELLRSCLDLTILSYAERLRSEDGRRNALATVVARRSQGGSQSYPSVPLECERS